jgi:hypothetical protein
MLRTMQARSTFGPSGKSQFFDDKKAENGLFYWAWKGKQCTLQVNQLIHPWRTLKLFAPFSVMCSYTLLQTADWDHDLRITTVSSNSPGMKHKFNPENSLLQMLEGKGSMEWGKRKNYGQLEHEQTFQYNMCHHSIEKPQTCAQFCLPFPTPEVYNCFLDKRTAHHDNTKYVIQCMACQHRIYLY